MPRLTRITETKRGRYALFLDDAFAFSLDEDTFAAAGLHAGDELTEPAVAELRRKSDARRALDKAMDLLALRDHAAGELYAKLCRRFDPHTAAAAGGTAVRPQTGRGKDPAGHGRAGPPRVFPRGHPRRGAAPGPGGIAPQHTQQGAPKP